MTTATENKSKDYRYFARLMALKKQLEVKDKLPDEPDYIDAQAGDVPMKYYKANNQIKRCLTPISVDTYSGKEFAQGMYESFSVSEAQRPALEKELNSYFPDVSKNEKALCTLSVRSCFDMYFQAR